MPLPSYDEYLKLHASSKAQKAATSDVGLVNQGRVLENQMKQMELVQRLQEADPEFITKKTVNEAKAKVEAERLYPKPAAKPKIAPSQIESLTATDNFLGGVSDLRKLLEKSNKELDTGRTMGIKNFIRKLGGSSMVPVKDSELEFDASANILKANFIKAISGATAADAEVERLSKFLPAITDTRQELKAKLKTLEASVIRSQANMKKQTKQYDAVDPVADLVEQTKNKYELSY